MRMPAPSPIPGLTGTPPVSLTLAVSPGSAPYVPASLPCARVHYSVTHSALAADAVTQSGV
jgi:hypothetical protein